MNTGAVFLCFRADVCDIPPPLVPGDWNDSHSLDRALILTGKTGHNILVTLENVMRKMPAAQFKAQCLVVMGQVSQSGHPVLITKHGKPVVRLVPANEAQDDIFGALAGIARITGDIESTVPASEWGEE